MRVQGWLFASLGVVEGIADLASGTLLDAIYSATVTYCASAVFILISVVYAVEACGFM